MEKNLKSSFKPNWHTRANSKQLLNEWEKLETKKIQIGVLILQQPRISQAPNAKIKKNKKKMRKPWTPAPISQPQIKLQATQVTWETRNPLRNPILSSKPQKELQIAQKEIQAYKKKALKQLKIINK